MSDQGVHVKATRLLEEGRVNMLPADCKVFEVEGDSGTYTVVIGSAVATCSCPATTACSHVEAARRFARAYDGAIDGHDPEASHELWGYVRRYTERHPA